MLAQWIEPLLRQSQPLDLEAMFQNSLDGTAPFGAFQSARYVAERCIEMGRWKRAAFWTRKMASVCVQENYPDALALALHAKQTPIVLSLYEKFHGQSTLEPEQAVNLARETIGLAMRLRLPQGRFGAWKKHLALLRIAQALLDATPPDRMPEQQRTDAEMMHELLGRLVK